MASVTATGTQQTNSYQAPSPTPSSSSMAPQQERVRRVVRGEQYVVYKRVRGRNVPYAAAGLEPGDVVLLGGAYRPQSWVVNKAGILVRERRSYNTGAGRDGSSAAVQGGYGTSNYLSLTPQERREVDAFYKKNPALKPQVSGSSGSQLIVQRGSAPTTTGQYLSNLKGAQFTYTTRPVSERAPLVATPETRERQRLEAARQQAEATSAAYRAQTREYNAQTTASGFRPPVNPDAVPSNTGFFAVDISPEKREQIYGSSWVARNFDITGRPLVDVMTLRSNVKSELAQNKALIDVEQGLRTTSEVNYAFVQGLDVKDVNVPYIGAVNPTKTAGSLVLSAPTGVLSGSIKDTRERPETIPLAYGAGKVFGVVAEGSGYIAGRYAASTANTGILFRSSSAGIAKGVQALPYVAGGAVVVDTGVKIAQEPAGTPRYEKIGSILPATASFVAGDLSVRGVATQGILKVGTVLTNAKYTPIGRVAEKPVVDYYSSGPETPGAQRFSVIERGNIEQNKLAFTSAKTTRNTYSSSVTEVPVQNRVDIPDVPRNPPIEVTRNAFTGEKSSLEVVHATTQNLPSSTTVLRGTSKQGGLYVAPGGRAQLYFLGLKKEPYYSFGLAKGGEPNLVVSRNIKGYSEELIPLFKKEGPGAATLSDAFLREQATPKTVYLEKRTYLGETPEVQAVIPEGTPLKQTNLRTQAQKFFGFREYTKLPDGTIIPIRLFTVLKKPPVQGVPSPGAKEIAYYGSESSSASSYKTRIDPFRIMDFTNEPPQESEVSYRPSSSSAPTIQSISSPIYSGYSGLQPSITPYAPSRQSASRGSSRPPSGYSPSPSPSPSPPVPSPAPSPPSYPSNAPSQSSRISPPPTPSPSQEPYKPYFFTSGPLSGGLFDVFVRRRGRFERVNARPVRLAEAFEKGQRVTGETAAASFKITPVSGNERELDSVAERRLPRSYYASKKERGVYIQQRSSRISSSGEKFDITYKGIASSRKKKRGGFL